MRQTVLLEIAAHAMPRQAEPGRVQSKNTSAWYIGPHCEGWGLVTGLMPKMAVKKASSWLRSWSIRSSLPCVWVSSLCMGVVGPLH